jgi:hypothetical protein
MANDWSKPKPVTKLDMAFGRINGLLPEEIEIPEEFQHWPPSTKFGRFICDWFFGGVVNITLKCKDGITQAHILPHIEACLTSWEPSQERKESGCAYLLSLWLDDISWEKAKKAVPGYAAT